MPKRLFLCSDTTIKRIHFSFFGVHQGVGRDELCQSMHIFWVLPLQGRKKKRSKLPRYRLTPKDWYHHAVLAAAAQLLSVGIGMSVCGLLQSTSPNITGGDKGRCRHLHSIMKQAMNDKNPPGPSSKAKLTVAQKKKSHQVHNKNQNLDIHGIGSTTKKL